MAFARQPRKRISTLQTRRLGFTDHSNRRATLVYRTETSLPPLYGFAVYFTHPYVDASCINAEKLLDVVTDRSTLQVHSYAGCPIHLKLYFLPGADEAECIAHYREEKAFLGDYRAQISAVASTCEQVASGNKTTFHPSPNAIGIPGFVPSYVSSPTIDTYHSQLFIVSEPECDAKRNSKLKRVQFDPVDQKSWAWIRGDGEPDTLPSTNVFAVWMFRAEEGEEGWLDGVPALGSVLAETAHVTAENLTNGVLQRAVGMGWESWPAAKV